MLKVKYISKKTLILLYEGLYKIRKVELAIEELYPQDEMKTPVHLCIGQEAIPVGICANLKKGDYCFSNHRGHGHYIAKGGDLKKMIAELYCKETGCSRGRGGSMHLIDTSVGFLGSSSIVGGSIPIAVGAALGSFLKKDNKVAVVFFGDAASEEGVLYESMNFAALKKLPVVFVCENNFYSVFSHISSRQVNNDPEKTANCRNLRLKMLVLPTKMRYNYPYQTYIAETSLLVGFVQDAQRDKKNHIFLRGSNPDSLRRNGYFPAVLSKVAAETTPPDLYFVESPKQPVSFLRTPAKHDLHYSCGDGTYLRYQDNPIQWLFSRAAGIEGVSEALDLERILEGDNLGRIARYHPCARLVAQENLESAASFQQPHLRSGFDRPAGIWLENRRGQSWIQPHQARAPQLSAFALLRRPYPGYLAWPLASWKHPSCKRSSSALVGLPKKDPQIPLPHQNSCRFGILRSQVHRATRRGKHWLRGSSQDDPAYSGKGSKPSLPYLQEKRVASSSVYLPTAQLEEATPVHRSAPPQTHMQRRRESTHALGIQGLLLSYVCYQSSLESRKRMAFLHAQSPMRTGYQRTQRKLPSGQYSHQQFLGQSGSFSFDSFGLRFGQLVQTSVSAATMELGYPAYSAQRSVCPASSFGSLWRKKSTQVATEVSPSETLLSGLQKNRPTQNSIDLSKTCSLPSSMASQKWAFSPFFQDNEIEEVFEFAKKSPLPNKNELTKYLYV